MPVSEPQRVRGGRIKLLLIAVLFSVPPLAAWVAWQIMDGSGVRSTTNAGTLIAPARPLRLHGLATPDGALVDDQQLRGRWTYVLFAPEGCDRRCGQQLYLTRQIRLAMNKDVRRVQRLLVLGSMPRQELAQLLNSEHADLTWVVRDQAAGPLLDRFRGAGFAPDGGQYFLVDPLGNLMMYYDLEVPAKGTMKDLRKLLKVSQIG